MSQKADGGCEERILVVDDSPRYGRVLQTELAAEGYRATAVQSGEQALAAFQSEPDPPDLVVLDVLMPGLNGFETCARIRALARGDHVPILFLTGASDPDVHDRAIAAGGDDLLRKPIWGSELLLRVRSLLRSKRLRDELRVGHELLRAQREALLEAQRQKDELSALVLHDLRGSLETVIAKAAPLLDGLPPADARILAGELLDAAEGAHRMILNFADLAAGEASLQACCCQFELRAALDEARTRHQRRAMRKSQNIIVRVDPEAHTIEADRELVGRLLDNLLDNALRFTPSGGSIELGARPEPPSFIDLWVRDQGPALADGYRDELFEPYVRLDRGVPAFAASSRGLGLAFCRAAARAHGGHLRVESAGEIGMAISVRLPAKRDGKEIVRP